MRYNKSAGLFPDGEYDATIVTAEEKLSKQQNPMIELLVRVYGSNGMKIEVSDWVGEYAIWKLKHLSASVGHDFDSGSIDPQDLIDRNIRVKLGTQKDEKFGEQNRILDYVGGARAVPDESDIPF